MLYMFLKIDTPLAPSMPMSMIAAGLKAEGQTISFALKLVGPVI